MSHSNLRYKIVECMQYTAVIGHRKKVAISIIAFTQQIDVNGYGPAFIPLFGMLQETPSQALSNDNACILKLGHSCQRSFPVNC